MNVRTLAKLVFVAVAVGFGAVAAQSEHQVLMHIEEVADRPLPVFYFEPIGLHVQPGDTVTFVAASPHHTATAYHGQHVKSQRVPEGVEPFSSPVVPVGESWSYTFTVPGTYDVWCAPHEPYGMAMRIVVGEPGGPAEGPVTEFGPISVEPAAAAVLNAPELASARIVELGTAPWADLLATVLAAPLD